MSSILTVAMVETAIANLTEGGAESVTLPTGVSYRLSQLKDLMALRRELMQEQGTGAVPGQPRRMVQPMQARR